LGWRFGGMTETRIERDTMGEVVLPARALYGAQTQRAVENFPISGQPLPAEFIRALGLVKLAAARVNRELGLLPPDVANAVEHAARSVAGGELDGEFPIDVFQTGSGTSSNMNANEVIAVVASAELGRRVHPNDEVNLGQSSNDVIPAVLHISAVLAIEGDLIPALRSLHDVLVRKAEEFDDVVKIGRTHLMDAVPIRLGQEFSGYARQIELAIERIGRRYRVCASWPSAAPRSEPD
jgi:fumarate hydratase class II